MKKPSVIFLHFWFFSFPLFGRAQLQDIYSFNVIDGTEPFGSLTLSGKVLFGTTYFGGTSGDGTIFSFNTRDSSYKKLFDFTGADGANPTCTQIISEINSMA